ncbi:MAG: hypothetical protein V4598_05120 [Bdellovibrionota bacterium]
MKFLLNFIFLSFTTTLFISCDSSSTGSSDNAVTTDFAITGSGMNATVSTSWFFPSAWALTPPPLVDANMANVDLFDAWIVVKKIHFFRTADPNALALSADHYQGPFFVDLLDGSPEPFGSIRLFPEGLRQVKMLLHKSNSIPAGVPAELSGNSIFFAGQVNGHNFSYVSDDTTDYKIYGNRAVAPESGKKLMVTLRIADLIKKIDLSAITADTAISPTNRVNAVNPCPLIQAGLNNLYSCFRQGMNTEAKFGKDNGDDDLSDDETVN